MNFKPSNFYIGIIDLFAILLPGAIVSLIIYHTNWLGIKSWLVSQESYGSFYSSFLFLLSAYLLGHIISQLSAYIDKWVYDNLNGSLVYDSKKAKRNVTEVKRIRKDIYQDYSGTKHLNTFEWSKNKLLKEQPAILDDIERYIADSKFFRSLILIFPILAGVLFNNSQKTLGWICLGLMAFSVVRYFHKRRKATETAYKSVIFLDKLHGGKTFDTERGGDTNNKDTYFRKNDNPNFKSHQSQIKFLQSGFNGKVSHIEIPAKGSWTTQTSLTDNEVWCCLQGRGMAYIPDNQNSKTILIPDASFPVPKGKSIRIENNNDQSLMIVAIGVS